MKTKKKYWTEILRCTLYMAIALAERRLVLRDREEIKGMTHNENSWEIILIIVQCGPLLMSQLKAFPYLRGEYKSYVSLLSTKKLFCCQKNVLIILK